MNHISRSLQLFFIDGRPDGMLTAEVFNWTGHVLRLPRTQLKDGLGRPEARFTGVYVLLGEQDGTPLAYVGEAEDMRERLRQHAGSKDWWDTAILITTSANNLHKAHVRYLESRLIAIARDVNAMALENGNQPSGSSLSEADRANMESFLETLMMVLPAIRVDNFLSKKKFSIPVTLVSDNKPLFELNVKKHGITAKARVIDGEMIVLEGSLVKRPSEHQERESTGLTRRRRTFFDLEVQGILGKAGEHNIFTVDYAFSSPSAAGDLITGRSANGRTEWKVVGTGQTYADWEDAQLAEAAP
ncbi:MAG: GIY-YIG nuclease family protein [Yoonia sp.]|uniref:GIY-YIG nuclease family protein n=1 Tax=Yoonia sp. TaxID=2212373 RepID=UPI003EF3F20C